MDRSVRDTSGLGSYSKRNSAGASAGKSARGETEEGVVRGWVGDEQQRRTNKTTFDHMREIQLNNIDDEFWGYNEELLLTVCG